MTFERAPHLSYADIPIAYVLELGGEEFLGLRDYNGDFRQIESLREIPLTDWQPVEMFGPSLGLLIPCRADITNPRGEPVGWISIRVVDGNPACIMIGANPGEALSSSLIKSIPIATLVREAATVSTVRVLKTEGGFFGARYVDGGPGFGQLLGDLREELTAVDEKARRRVISPDFLRDVAAIYREAVSHGIAPARAVQDALGPTTPTNARRWIAAARREGFLGPAPAVGRAGELTHVPGTSS
jgi:hypothetical protein